MPNELLRDLLLVSRHIFDEAVASVQAQANRDIDQALREASLWAYEQAHRNPKSELRRINEEAQRRAEGRVAEIQAAAVSSIDAQKTQLREREKSIRAYCEQRGEPNQDSHGPVASPDQCFAQPDGE